MPVSSRERKHLKAIGHKLKPIVTVAQKGLTDAIGEELDRALNDHELIKVKLAIGDRLDRAAVAAELERRLAAECVQRIGHVILLYRPAARPDPRLSNLLRTLD